MASQADFTAGWTFVGSTLLRAALSTLQDELDAAQDELDAYEVATDATLAKTRRGTATLSSGTATVTLDPAEADTSYFILLTGDAEETFHWGTKATGSFVITSSNESSTAHVDWLLTRA